MITVILAGGSGKRFWPLSRRTRPKQLIRLWDDIPMIEATVDRLEELGSRDKTFVVLGEHLVEPTREALEDVSFIVEPAARNTAPAIGLAAAFSLERFGDEPMAVFPADHYIGDIHKFRMCLNLARAKAEEGHIVTLGIEPTSAETGYGYIHYREPTDGRHRIAARPVLEFVEKPSRKVAEQYVESGDYAWNSGMFVFRPSVLFGEMERQLPEMYKSMMRIRQAIGTDEEQEVIAECFADMESISIDYGIMEGAEDVVVIPSTFSWSDVGHWAAIDEVRETDGNDNVVEAEALLKDVSDSVIYSEGTDRLIAVCGVDGLVVVDTPDALLVVPKDRAQDVKAIVEQLEEDGRDDLL
ncbi:MAG: mannose-1-phosphate guanylyltransferase [Persicimonas sp.]